MERNPSYILFCLFLGFLFSFSQSQAQILTFEFSALAGDEVSANSNSNNSNISSSTITRGSGLNASSNAGRFNATSWATTSIANAVSGNDYMEFTITPNSGYNFSVSSIYIQLQRSGTGPSAIAIRNSLDNYATNLDQEYAIADVATTQNFTFTFSQTASSSAVTYRIYMYAESTGGSGGIGDGSGNDIIVYGSVTPTSSVEDPQSFTATSSSTSQINLSATANTNTNDVLVAYNTSNTFGTPTGTYAVSDPLSGGGTILYSGTAASLSNHTGLNANTTYYYKAWSYDGSDYSTGIEANATTDCVTPNEISNLNLTAGDQNISVSWTNPTGCFDDVIIVVAEAINNGSPSGTNYTNDLNYLGSGAALGNGKVVYQGNVSPQTITGLSNGIEYYVKVFTRYSSSWSYGEESSATPVNIVNPSSGNVFITEVSDAASFNNEFMEIFNPSADKIDLSSTKLIRLSSEAAFEYAFDFSTDGVGDTEIEPYGFLIIARGNSKANFEAEFGALPANTNYNEGNSQLFFGLGRRWQLKDGGTANTDDGTLIDDTQSAIANGNRAFKYISENGFSGSSVANANPGLLSYTVASNNVWIGTEPSTATGNLDIVVFADLTLTKDIFCDEIRFKSGKLTLSNHNITILDLPDNMSSSSYIVAEGTGVVKMYIESGDPKTYPVGTSNYYIPITIDQKGTADTIMIRVEEQVFDNGTSGTPQTSDALDVSWIIEEKTPGDSRVDLTVEWPSSAELSGFNATACFFSHYRDGNWYPGSAQDVSGSDPRTITLSEVTSFSPFAIGSGNSPLPVELANFNAIKIDNLIKLYWQTLSEQGVDKFLIKKGGEIISTIEAAGESNFTQNYAAQYQVNSNEFPITFELWEQDKNGIVTQLGQTTVNTLENEGVFISQMENYITINAIRENSIQLQVTDIQGRIIFKESSFSGQTSFYFPKKGVYFLTLFDEYFVETKKFSF